MIENLFPRSRTTEVADTANLIGQAYDGSNVEDDTYLENTMNELSVANAQLLSAANRDKAESNLAGLDETCDDKVQAFYYILQGALHHPSNEVKTAAQRLQNIFDNYGMKMVRENYASESAMIKSMLQDYSARELAPDLAAVSGIGDVLAELGAAHAAFEQARIAYENSKADEGQYENATKLKIPVVEIVNNRLVLYLNAMVLVAPEKYDQLARRIAQIIADNNQRVARRRKKPEGPENTLPTE